MSHRGSKTIVCDFDGVIATYDGWKGFDVFGQPILSTIRILHRLKNIGWKIVIFTTRLATPTLEAWLEYNAVPYDAINSTAHNPPNTSNKPIADVYLDDRAINPLNFDYEEGLYTKILEMGGK
jgi:hypothetical protein